MITFLIVPHRVPLSVRCLSFSLLATLSLASVQAQVVEGGDGNGSQPSFDIKMAPTKLEPILFPPPVPPLNEGFATVSEQRLAAKFPKTLRVFANDVFCAPLSTRIATADLNEELRTTLLSYRTAKVSLQNELRAKLEAVAALPLGERIAALEKFATDQAPRISELEAVAGSLRARLAKRMTRWDDYREWRLGRGALKSRGPSTASFEAEVARSLAYYGEGLSMTQRRLLREVAAQRQDTPRNAAPSKASEGRLIYFSPELAAVRIPADLPAALEAKIATFDASKAALKNELAEVVFREDGRFFGPSPKAFQSLAAQHEAQMKDLESLAEEIRRGLAQAGAVPRAAGHQNDYRNAVFEPGLSSEQRRLLFDRAVEHVFAGAALAGTPTF
jgi:hypothetical protein